MSHNNTLQAFVSSTYIDLSQHREHVISALRKAGIQVDSMEDWQANTQEPKILSTKRLDGCDFFVLLVGFRRGHVPHGEYLSITQMEYRVAMARGMDVLVFLLRDDVLKSGDSAWPAEFFDEKDVAAVCQWRNELREKHVCGWFGPDPRSVEIETAVARWIREHAPPLLARWRQTAARLWKRGCAGLAAFCVLALAWIYGGEEVLVGPYPKDAIEIKVKVAAHERHLYRGMSVELWDLFRWQNLNNFPVYVDSGSVNVAQLGSAELSWHAALGTRPYWVRIVVENECAKFYRVKSHELSTQNIVLDDLFSCGHGP